MACSSALHARTNPEILQTSTWLPLTREKLKEVLLEASRSPKYTSWGPASSEGHLPSSSSSGAPSRSSSSSCAGSLHGSASASTSLRGGEHAVSASASASAS
eukprot:CAMPEP_0183458796 /NCGR_PEP_ID=MMETSP0370-20130417/134240_1 /TAXON_ID=268820 /ORGANISM="Peridinium aciculiferum, Strain PAER-2" /LENGTH=101 /DNA_ID=CAMNT_0025650587 /DNA_START=12 /DNA_END=314 /DNA_ORIENTATION=+